jgi:hypothetical protein
MIHWCSLCQDDQGCWFLQALGLAVGTLRSELQVAAEARAKEQQQQLRHELEGEETYRTLGDKPFYTV